MSRKASTVDIERGNRETKCGGQVERRLAPAIENRQLVPDHHGFGDHGTGPSGPVSRATVTAILTPAHRNAEERVPVTAQFRATESNKVTYCVI